MKIVRQGLTAAILWIATISSASATDPTQQNKERRDVAPPVTPLAAQPLDRMSNTRDRPLFSPTRRPPAPPPVVVAAPPPPPPPPDVVLLAVVMDGEDARAIVRAGPAAKILRVGIGDDIDGWKVGQIERLQMVLLLDDRTATFRMFTGDNKNASPNASAAAPPSADKPPSGATHQNVVQQHQAATDEPVPASRKRAH